MTNPQTPSAPTFTREYSTDAHYQADSLALVRSGWRVISVQRTPVGAIIATYAPTTAVSTPTVGHAEVATIPWRETLARVKGRLGMRWFIGGMVGGVVVLALLVGLLVSALAAPASPTTDSSVSEVNVRATATANAAYAASLNATATALTHIPTATPSTATPAPVMMTGARLGGPIDDFDATFGSSTTQDTSQGIWDTTLAGQDVQLTVSLTNPGDSNDSQDRAVIIDISQQGGSAWSASEDAAIVASFVPPDATHVRIVSGWSDLGPDHIYLSHQLANSLAASVFENSGSQQLTPGTFDWQCSTSTAMCEIAAGTNS